MTKKQYLKQSKRLSRIQVDYSDLENRAGGSLQQEEPLPRLAKRLAKDVLKAAAFVMKHGPLANFDEFPEAE